MNILRLKKIIIYVLFVLLLVLPFNSVVASDVILDEENPLIIYFFRAHGCSYCEQAAGYLRDLQKFDLEIEVVDFDVYLDPEARVIYEQVLTYLNRSAQGMPTIIIGDTVWVGFQENYKSQIEEVILQCTTSECPDIIRDMENKDTANSDQISKNKMQPAIADISIPLFGNIALTETPFFLSTFIIGFVDGFNPCSLWVLTVLLSLTLYMQSRPKTLLIGLTFIIVSALIYALFISGLFTALSLLKYQGIIQVLVSMVALILAVINIKDYFFFKQGPSLSISDSAKPGLYERMRRLTVADKAGISLFFGTVVLSAGVSLVEFSCTAGFPIVWVNLLTHHQVSTAQYILLLVFYLFIYMLDELAIFFSVVFTMRSVKIDQHQGRFLKLLSGLVMLTLSVIMLTKPELMNDLLPVILLFTIVICTAFVIDRITRRLINA